MKRESQGVCLAHEDVGSGPAIVLIHGYPLCRQMWRPQVEALTEAGYRVVSCDLRGFGESAPGEDLPSIDAMADDVAGLLDMLGIERAAVAGMSMGGYVLLNLLERHRRRVAAALFVVTRAGADDEPARMRRTALAAEVASGRPEAVTEVFADILFAEATLRQQPEAVAEVRAWMARNAPQGLAQGLLAMRDRRDSQALLASFDLPALVVGAEQDRAIPGEHSQSLAQGLLQATLRIIPDAGHMVNIERPATFNACFLEFLGEHFPV